MCYPYLCVLVNKDLHLSTPNKQAEFIAAMLGLDASAPLWLVKQSGNVAVAARCGKFAGPLIVPGATYDVRGRSRRISHLQCRREQGNKHLVSSLHLELTVRPLTPHPSLPQ